MIEVKELPKGWVSSSLGELGNYINGRGFSKSEWSKTGRPIIRIQDLTGTGGEPNFFDGEVEEKYRVKPGDLLVSWAATLGAYVWRGAEGWLNQHIFRVESFIEQSFHYYLIQAVLDDLKRQTHGGGIVHITRGKFDDTQVALPPFNEQRRLVAKLEELFSDLDASVTALERARANLKRYRASVLKAAVEGRLTAEWRKSHPPAETASQLLERILAERRKKWEQAQLAKFAAAGKAPPKNWKDKYPEPTKPDTAKLPEVPEGWCWAHIEQLCEYGDHALKAGPFGSAIKKSMYVPDGYKIYGQEQVIRGDPYYGDYFIDQEKFVELSSCAIKPGDLLISLVGTIGRTLVLPDDCKPGIINPRLIKISLERKLVFPAFLQAFIRSPQVKTIFKLISHGGTMDVLNMGALKALAYPLPPLAEQEAIVDALESADDMIGRSEIELSKSTEKSIQLRQSILKRAFEGRLVPQDPNDEPASVLLERIRVARMDSNAGAAQKSRKQTSRKGGG